MLIESVAISGRLDRRVSHCLQYCRTGLIASAESLAKKSSVDPDTRSSVADIAQVDETDRFQDNRSHKAAKRAGPAAVMRKSRSNLGVESIH